MAMKAAPPIAGQLSFPSLHPLSSRSSQRLNSAFLGNGSLKVSVLRLANTSKLLRCNGHGGGSLGSQMNLLDRCFRIIRAYVNSIVSSFEDPEKMLEQCIVEMNGDLAKIRKATVEILGSQKLLENKYEAAQKASEDWYGRARLALRNGKKDLAREALQSRKSFVDDANALKSQLDHQKVIVDSLVIDTRVLENKIQEAKSKKDTLKARAQSAKTVVKVSQMLGNVNTRGAFSAFEKMEEKVFAMECQAQALNQLTIDDLEGQFTMLERSSVDDDMATLMNELSESSKPKRELPPRSSDDLETLMNELSESSKPKRELPPRSSDDMKTLMNELSESSKPKSELPPRSSDTSSTSTPFPSTKTRKSSKGELPPGRSDISMSTTFPSTTTRRKELSL